MPNRREENSENTQLFEELTKGISSLQKSVEKNTKAVSEMGSNRGALAGLGKGFEKVGNSLSKSIQSLTKPFADLAKMPGQMLKSITEGPKKLLQGASKWIGGLFGGGKDKKASGFNDEQFEVIQTYIEKDTKISNDLSKWLEILSSISGKQLIELGEIKGFLLKNVGEQDEETLEERQERIKREKSQHEEFLAALAKQAPRTEESSEPGGGFFSKLFGGLLGGKGGAGGLAVLKGTVLTLTKLFAVLSKGVVTLGIAVSKALLAIFTGLSRGLMMLTNPKLFIGIAVLAGLAGTLFLAGKAFQQFGETNWASVFIGIGALTTLAVVSAVLAKASPLILVGALAIAALSGSLLLAGKAFQQFGEIDWSSFDRGLESMGKLALMSPLFALAGIGLIIAAPGFLAFGSAMLVLATAFRIFAPAANIFINVFDSFTNILATFISNIGDTIIRLLDGVANTIERLSNIGGDKLRDVANGINRLGGALAAFGVGGAFAGAVEGFMSFFGADTASRLTKIGKTAPSLETLARSFKAVGRGIDMLRDLSGGDVKDIEKRIKEIGDIKMKNPLEPLISGVSRLRAELGGFGRISNIGKHFNDFINELIQHSFTDVQNFFNRASLFMHLLSNFQVNTEFLDFIERLMPQVTKLDSLGHEKDLSNEKSSWVRSFFDNLTLIPKEDDLLQRRKNIGSKIESMESEDFEPITSNDATSSGQQTNQETTVINRNSFHQDYSQIHHHRQTPHLDEIVECTTGW